MDTRPRVDVAALDALTMLLAQVAVTDAHHRMRRFSAYRGPLTMRIGEVMMQCQRNVRHNHRTRTTQFDLFAAPGGEAVLTPAWGALPEETRSAVTGLMVQLILDHADARGPQPEEAGHDL